MYTEGRFGQVHVRVARPDDDNEIQRPPLLCLHQSPKSSRQMVQVAARLGTDRFVYAPDFPGFGESDRPNKPPRIEDYAAAIGDVLDGLNVDRLDIYGYHTGAMNAVELAVTRPAQVRRLVLIGIPILNDEEKAAIHNAPWPVPVKKDGSHLITEWQRAVNWAGPGQTLDMLAEGFADKLSAGNKAFWGARAAADYDLAGKIQQVEQPVLAIGPKDDNWENTPRAEPLLKNGQLILWPDYGFGVMDVAPDMVCDAIRNHLDR